MTGSSDKTLSFEIFTSQKHPHAFFFWFLFITKIRQFFQREAPRYSPGSPDLGLPPALSMRRGVSQLLPTWDNQG